MKYYVYILKSRKNRRYYIGMCKDLTKRITEHNRGKTRSTKNGIPWEIVLTEDFYNRRDAYKRERQIKRYKGGQAFKELLRKGG